MKNLIPRQIAISKAVKIVPYLTPEEAKRIAEAVRENRNGERNSLLITLLFQTGLRISEALALCPKDISLYNGKPMLYVLGKGKKLRMTACPEPLTDKLRSYAYTHNLNADDRFFPIDRRMAWLIVKKAGEKAGITKRIYCHLFRHSDAIERLRQTGNPRALQHHLGHSSAMMTMRYLSTLQEEDSLKIQQEVQFE